MAAASPPRSAFGDVALVSDQATTLSRLPLLALEDDATVEAVDVVGSIKLSSELVSVDELEVPGALDALDELELEVELLALDALWPPP
jgi:hypothetical protein